MLWSLGPRRLCIANRSTSYAVMFPRQKTNVNHGQNTCEGRHEWMRACILLKDFMREETSACEQSAESNNALTMRVF